MIKWLIHQYDIVLNMHVLNNRALKLEEATDKIIEGTDRISGRNRQIYNHRGFLTPLTQHVIEQLIKKKKINRVIDLRNSFP